MFPPLVILPSLTCPQVMCIGLSLYILKRVSALRAARAARWLEGTCIDTV